MLLSDIHSKILVESGQFMIENHVELDYEKTIPVVRSVLSTYSEFHPYDAKFNIDATDNYYTFLESSSNGIPDWIAEVVPIRLLSTYPFYLRQNEGLIYNEYLSVKEEFPWEYRKPTLYIPITGKYDVNAVYNHTLVSSDTDNDGRLTYEITTIEESDRLFFDLLAAKFMIALGRSRRAFTLNDLPITNDSAELVSDGQTQYEQTLEELKENHSKVWLAIDGGG